MPSAAISLPITTSKSLDAIADQVLELAQAQPRPTNRALVAALHRRFALEVSPDNLRVWLARRYADRFRARVTPAVRCPLDDHLELVIELRDPRRQEGVFFWTQVLSCLKEVDPSLDYTPEGLRSWYSRRTSRAAKAKASAKAALAGRASLATFDSQPNDVPGDDHGHAPTPWGQEALASQISSIPPKAGGQAVPADMSTVEGRRAAAAAELVELRNSGSNGLGDMLRAAGVKSST